MYLEEKPDLSKWETLKVIFIGHTKTGMIKKPGWSGSLPIYAFACPVHGIVQNYPMGYKGRLECPECPKPKYSRPSPK